MSTVKGTWMVALLAACGSGGGGGYYRPFGDLAMETPSPDLAMQQGKPDLALERPDLAREDPPDLAMEGPKRAVGAPCTASTMCGGTSAKCHTTTVPTYMFPVPGGYCSNTSCTGDNDCGEGGFCDQQSSLCFGECMAKGDCQKVNPNNRCFIWDQTHAACLPQALSQCNPTVNGMCANNGGCIRSGLDDVGRCYEACTFGGACPNNAQGKAQACYYINRKIDSMGNASGDAFAGLICIGAGMGALNSACKYINDCASGLECDFYGGKTCKKICRNGMADCTAPAVCSNAFKLQSFGQGAFGLCL